MAKRRDSTKVLSDIIVFVLKLFWKIITLPFWIYKKFKKKNVAVSDQPDQAPIYKRKHLLTKHEWNFYKALKPIADKLGLVVLAKIRMADLVETVAHSNSEYYKGFSKVKAKHVDFALCRPDNLYIELLIELDDNTHTPGNERDVFVESVYKAAGYTLLRIRNEIDLENNIKAALGVKIIAGPATEPLSDVAPQLSR